MARVEAKRRRRAADDRQRGIPALQRLAEGKAARAECSRSSQAATKATYDRDVVELLVASNEDRLPELVPIRHSRMLESAFAFFRGTAIVQAHDLAKSPNSGIYVQACGDCHLLNFGGFATPERQLIFDLNDFDETFPAPWEWDLKRLAASLVLAARWRGFPKSIADDVVRACVERYREKTWDYALTPTMETWYAQVSYDELMRRQSTRRQREIVRTLASQVDQATQRTSEHVFNKLVVAADGAHRIADQPPLLFHPVGIDAITQVPEFLELYGSTLREEYRGLLSRFRFVDAAVKVVGVGSVGTRCYAVLMLGQHDEPLFLQVKEARASVLEQHTRPSPWSNNGQPVVVGQRIMQANSDIFLGWSRGREGRDFYVRQLRDMKVSADVTKMSPAVLRAYAQLCGRTLARAHAKGGEAQRIAGYLGKSDAFDDAIARYAGHYADQVERDYAAFQEAARNGRIQTETSPAAGGTLAS